MQLAPNLRACLTLCRSVLSFSCRSEAAGRKEGRVSLEKRTACAKARTPAEHNDLGEAVVPAPQLPCTVLKDTSRNSIEFLCQYSFMSLLSQDRSKVCNTAQGTSTPHFWLTSSAFSCCLFCELYFSHVAKLTCSLLFLCHWPCHFSGLR